MSKFYKNSLLKYDAIKHCLKHNLTSNKKLLWRQVSLFGKVETRECLKKDDADSITDNFCAVVAEEKDFKIKVASEDFSFYFLLIVC